MQRVYRNLLIFFAAVGVISSFSMSDANAQGVNDFVITDFSAEYQLTNEDPQGTLYVTETIELDFSGQNQGILRAIPNTYQGNDLNLDITSIVRDGATEPHLTYQENDNTVIRIGEAGKYITGEHVYEIAYVLENVILFSETYDEFYWDINGDQWLQPFNSVNLTLSTPAVSSSLPPRCFTGTFGSESADCEVDAQVYGLDASTTRALNPAETLTVQQFYEKGYFTPPGFWEKHSKTILAVPLVMAALLIVKSSYSKWQKFGKDYKQRSVAPFYDRPKDISVMQSAYVAKNRLSTKDISASIIDLAIKGYLKVIESKDGRKTNHSFELIKPKDNKLTADESLLLTKLFSTNKIGEVFNVEKNKNKLSSTLTELTKQLQKLSSSKGYYEVAPGAGWKYLLKQIVASIGLIGLSLILTKYVSPIALFAGIGALLLVLIFLGLMTKRSHSGVMLKEHVDGLNLYLSKAEKDRIKMHDAVAAPLSTRGNPPKYDRKFFEKLLPFAVAAGVEKSWSKAFTDIYKEAPEWYQGTSRSFTAATLANSIGSTVKATSQTFTSPSSSSGGGGGGFSGGGGGGGGGGGW